MVQIKHLSVSVEDPESAAKTIAEMTGGVAKTFSSTHMTGAWVCMWDEKTNHLIEFLPNDYLMYPTEYGADFKKLPMKQNFNSTHIQLETDMPLSHIKKISDDRGFEHKFRPYRGGPLYDVWIEDQLLVEFVSEEIRSLSIEERSTKTL